MPGRVLFLGADALDHHLVLRWAQDGMLPAFRRLLSSAAWGVTENPPGLYVGAVWPSFWTCVGPARHARYCYEQLRPGTYDFARIRPADTQAPPFWDALDCAGKRVAIIDVPKTYPSELSNGMHVVDWGTHDPDYDGPVTWPSSLASELVASYGRDGVGNCNAHGKAGEYATLRDQLLARIGRKKQMILDTLARADWDALLAVFSESHCAGHQCWHLHDPTHVKHDPELAAQIGNPLRDVYVAIDAAMGEIIERAGDADVIVLGSHGMRSHYDATFMLDDMLRRIENPRRAAPAAGASGSLAKSLWKHTPRGVRALLRPFKEPAKARLDPGSLASRRWFAVPNNDVHGAIRLNLAGREPAGRVSRAEFDAVCRSLEQDLLAFVNMDTGEPVVRRVWRIDQMYSGPNLHHLPDLIVEWNRDHPIARAHSEKTGEIHGVYRKPRTGDHSEHGIFFMRGDGIPAGRVDRPVSIMDFGPTIGARLGVSLEDIDGRPITGAA
jgi:predicted AlkP superfamily phosphohydrolase/phosphomutase